eukprot:11362327-Alexandrium_andersonii.AAC.1
MAAHAAQEGATAALAERYVPDVATDLCRAAKQHLSEEGARGPFASVAKPGGALLDRRRDEPGAPPPPPLAPA